MIFRNNIRSSRPGAFRRLANFAILGLTLLSLQSQVANAQIPGSPIPEIPQIPAFLPMAHTVPQMEATPIDGEWVITSIGKRIRIQAGRAFAVDPWVHLFVLKIEPLMVVIKDIRRVGPGQYSGQDLPLMGAWSARLGKDGNLVVNVAGVLGPAQYALMPVTQDDPRAFTREKAGEYAIDYEDDNDEGGYDEGDYDEGDYDEGDYDDDYADEDWEDDYEEEYEEDAPKKVSAIKRGKAKSGCKGKQIYLSGGSCYSCPNGYKRFSPIRKMTHPEACTERGFGSKKVKAKYRWGANGCPGSQFKYKGYCMVCPDGTKRMHIAGLDTGYCKVL